MQTIGLFICFVLVIWYIDYRCKKLVKMVTQMQEATIDGVCELLKDLEKVETAKEQHEHMIRIIRLEAQIHKQGKTLQKVVDIINNK